MIKKYQHIFFDLDHTLWDFSTNSSETLYDIINAFKLNSYISDTEKWVESFAKYNKQVWEQFDLGKFKKAELRIERFRLLLSEININNEDLAKQLSEYYIAHSPRKAGLMPHTLECLDYLSDKYVLHIISNGFNDIQLIKLRSSGILKFFKSVTTSDKVLSAKPDKRIFEEALKPVNARKRESLMVGDNAEKDVEGAKKFGMDQVWYNPHNNLEDVHPTYTITSLLELNNIL